MLYSTKGRPHPPAVQAIGNRLLSGVFADDWYDRLGRIAGAPA
jgi:hypothetical protein